MDKLLITVLLLVFLLGYPGILLTSLLMLIVIGVLDITYLSLFFMTLLSVYNIHGSVGVCVLLLSTASFIISGYMYMSNVSSNDLFKSPYNKNDTYNTNLKIVYNKTGISYEHIHKMHVIYDTISLKYDILCDNVYTYLCYFREMTEDINCFKYIYTLYDKCIIINKNINQLRNLFNIKPSTTRPDNIISTATMLIDAELKQENNNDDIGIYEVEDNNAQEIKPVNIDSFTTLFGNDKNVDINNDDILDVEDNNAHEIKPVNSESDTTLFGNDKNEDINNENIHDVEDNNTQEIKLTNKSTKNDPFSSLFGNGKNVDFNNIDFNNIMAMNQHMERQLSGLQPEQKQQLDKIAMTMMGDLFSNYNKKKE